MLVSSMILKLSSTYQAELELSDSPVFFLLLTQHLHSYVPVHNGLSAWPVAMTLGLQIHTVLSLMSINQYNNYIIGLIFRMFLCQSKVDWYMPLI